MKVDLDRLCRRLNYHFHDKAYLKRALTHCSVGNENYERFEFLGDSILSFVIATALFQQFPHENEGQLSRLRAFLVKGDTLAEIGKEIGLGDFLYLGQGELKSGGHRRASILADALEAIFAAIFLDGGVDVARETILNLYRSRLDDSNLNDCLKDHKTRLQEYLQAQKLDLPEYVLTKIEGEEHDQIFHISCSITGVKFQTFGEGPNRRKAEQHAAKGMLKHLLNL